MKSSPSESNASVASGKRPALFTIQAVEYYESLAMVSIRRLWSRRASTFARSSIRGWIGTLRDARRVRAYRGWNAA